MLNFYKSRRGGTEGDLAQHHPLHEASVSWPTLLLPSHLGRQALSLHQSPPTRCNVMMMVCMNCLWIFSVMNLSERLLNFWFYIHIILQNGKEEIIFFFFFFFFWFENSFFFIRKFFFLEYWVNSFFLLGNSFFLFDWIYHYNHPKIWRGLW